MSGGKHPVFSLFLEVLGVMIMVLSGSCSSYFLYTVWKSPFVIVVVAVGGVFFLIGLLLWFLGKRRI